MNGDYEQDLNTKSKTKGQLAKAYADLVSSAKSGNVTRSVVSDFKSLVGKCNSQFIGYGQQDAQEFLRFAIDGLSADLNRVKIKPKFKELKFKTETKEEQSEKWWEYFKSIEDSFITDLFQGQLMSNTECHLCGHQSLAFDNFMDLSLSLPKEESKSLYSRTSSVSLKDCLDEFTSEEKFDSD